MFQFYKDEPRKFFFFFRTAAGGVDTELFIPSGKQILNTVYKPKRTYKKIKADVTKQLMNIFILNKKCGIGVNLDEIKKMTPFEGYFFIKNVADTLAILKEMRNKRGN